MLNVNKIIAFNEALRNLYPNIVTVCGDIAYDANGNQVIYDFATVNAQVEIEAQTAQNAKESALAKLAALGLTQDEVKALVG